ncbi:MAG TPA: IS1 family transposase [Bryobacteraceae bacterium]|jgi:transposase-like protein/IS1 family transposase|nr:IS1 family transposase [Bryobacteraceae bacterium]
METLTAKVEGTLTCTKCGVSCKRFGKHRNGLQRFRCRLCGATFTEDHEVSFRIEDYLGQARGIMAIQLLVEGCSIRTVERITGLHRDAIMRLLLAAGERCERLMDTLIQNVPARDVQSDEIWSFVGKKEKNTTLEDNPTLGDSYCWVAIEARTKLVLSFVVGKRSVTDAIEFTRKLRRATSASRRFQLTTDGLPHYVTAVDLTLSDRCDFAQLIKIYASPREGDQRYSPGEVVEAVPVVISGNPNPNRICTSHVERQNLTMRMQIRRLTRLTNAFSKKFENHKAAIALHFAYYNFCQIHRTLRVTPAMEARITDRVWTIAELMA